MYQLSTSFNCQVNGTYKDATEQPISSSGVEVIRDVLITAEVVEPQQETDFSEPTQVSYFVKKNLDYYL